MYCNITKKVDTIKKRLVKKDYIDVLIDKGHGAQSALNKCETIFLEHYYMLFGGNICI